MLGILLIFVFAFSKVSGAGILEIRLVDFDNPGGRGANGHCCDGRLFFCERDGGCDHYFIGCVNTYHGEAYPCFVGKFETGVIPDQKSIHFGSDIGGTRNPIQIEFTDWESPGISLQVEVFDKDRNDNDLVDRITQKILIVPAQSEYLADFVDVRMTERTMLLIKVKAYCAEHYHGPACATYCKAENSHRGHYACDAGTGSKICHAGWSGTFCSINIDDCSSSPCVNGGKCVDMVDAYRCSCQRGYIGRNCETMVNYCISGPCRNNGKCTMLPNAYACQCDADFTGSHCESEINHCLHDPCHNEALCSDGDGRFDCLCRAGWTGLLCETEIDECASQPCVAGHCRDQLNGYRCLCRAGFTGVHCDQNIDECASSPCHGPWSQCIDGVDGYSCDCPAGTTGVHCELEVDACSSRPCLNVGLCVTDNRENWYECICDTGWTGVNCEVNIDDCQSNPCANNQSCIDGIWSYLCNCSSFWQGVHCERDTDECAADVCRNNATCENFPGGYSCNCTEGWAGTDCDVEIDECTSSPCRNNATCTDLFLGFFCSCAQGYNGSVCDEDVDECIATPCLSPNQTCTNFLGGYDCVCPLGYDGEWCKQDIDECESQPCRNGEICTDLVGHYNCSSKAQYKDDTAAKQQDTSSRNHQKKAEIDVDLDHNSVGTDISDVAVIFIGHVSSDELRRLRDETTSAIVQVFNITTDDAVHIELSQYICYTAQGEQLTSIIFHVTINSEHIEAAEFQGVIDYLHGHGAFKNELYTGLDCLYGYGLKQQQTVSREPMFEAWYVIPLVLVLVSILVIIAALVSKKQRKSNPPSSPSASTSIHQNPAFSYHTFWQASGSESVISLLSAESDYQPVGFLNGGMDGGNRGMDGGNRGMDGGNRGMDAGNRGKDGGNRDMDGVNRGMDGGNRGRDGVNRGIDDVNRGEDGWNRGMNGVNRGMENTSQPAHFVNRQAVNHHMGDFEDQPPPGFGNNLEVMAGCIDLPRDYPERQPKGFMSKVRQGSSALNQPYLCPIPEQRYDNQVYAEIEGSCAYMEI